MATLDSSEANIFEAETINWRLIVYPLLAVLVLLVGGFSYYYYQQTQRDTLEAQARQVMLKAKTAEEFVKVADQFPDTDTAKLALLKAADLSFNKPDYMAAIADYQRILNGGASTRQLNDSAQVGLAATLEASGKIDDAIQAYLVEARLGNKSPYAPYAYFSASRLYEQKGDKETQRKILNEATGLDPDSAFVQQAKEKLKELNAAATPPLTQPVPAPAPAATAPAVSAPVPAATPPATNAPAKH
jgi:tetratricopeptide (TPR) repeat protein